MTCQKHTRYMTVLQLSRFIIRIVIIILQQKNIIATKTSLREILYVAPRE